MKIKCEYCGSYLNDYDEKCKNCGAQNKNLNRQHEGEPKTIEELQKWFKVLSLTPEEKQHFSIGNDISRPNCEGIYKNKTTGKITTYKNDSSSKRKIIYEGDDEEYAVNVIYNDIRDKMMKHKNDESRIFNAVAGSFETFNKIHSFMTIFVVFFVVIVFLIMLFIFSRTLLFFR